MTTSKKDRLFKTDITDLIQKTFTDAEILFLLQEELAERVERGIKRGLQEMQKDPTLKDAITKVIGDVDLNA